MAVKKTATRSQEFSDSVIDTVREPLIVLDHNLRIITASRSFYEFFKVKPEETEGQLIYDLGYKQWDIPKLRELLETILPQKKTFDNYEVEHDFPTIGKRIMLLNARQIKRVLGKERIILLAIEDITERREIEIGLEKARIELEATKISEDAALEYAESIIDTIREPLIILDHDLRIVTASRSFYEFFKVKPEETEGQLIYELSNKQWDIPKLRKLLETILPQNTTFENYEIEHDFVSIGKRIMLLNARQIHRVLGKERIILLAIEDITKHKRLENILKESEELYRDVFNNASDGIVLLEKREGKIIHINPSAENMLGYSTKECIGNKLQDIGFMSGVDDFQTIMQKLNENGIVNYNNVPLTTKSGQYLYTDIYLVNKTKAVQCNIRDVTERKLAEEALKKSEANYRQLFDNSPVAIYQFDYKKGKITKANDLFCEYLGCSQEEITSLNPYGFLTEDSKKLLLERMEKISQGVEVPEIVEYEGFDKKGKRWILQLHNKNIYDAEGHLVAVDVVAHDITEHKQSEEALRKSEENFRLSLDESPLGVRIVTAEGETLYANRAIVDIYGYDSIEELRGAPLKKLYTPESYAEFKIRKEKRERGELGPSEYEISIVRKNGEIRLLHVFRKEIFWNGKKQSQVVYQDITERKQAEEKLHQTLDRLSKAFGATVQVMVSAIEMRDPYTSGHQLRSANLACAIAKEMELPQDKIDGLRMAGSIHDIGKLSIPAEILSKPTKLTNTEFSLIKEHSLSGYEMLKNVESPWPLAQIVYQHHERMDGSGYPRNLKGDEILMEARIMAVADVVEAMASHRPYRPALGIDTALAEIEKNKGTHYDNAVADACLKLFREKDYKLLA